MNYAMHLVIYFDIYIILSLSLNIVVGYCGMLTLAHASYYAIGAYVYAVLTLTSGLSFIPAIIAGIGLAAILSLAVSLPSWRLQRDFFVLATLVVQVFVFTSLYNWFDANATLGTWRNLTNGSFGISGIPKPSILGVTFAEPAQYAALATGIALICGILIWRLKSSSWGLLLIAMRDDDLALRGLGKNTRLLRAQAIAFSCSFAAVSGALYAGYVNYLHPSTASLDESILILSMVLVGGSGNFRGPLIGAALLVALPELIRLVELPDAQAAQIRLMIYGVLLTLLVHFRPAGLAGTYRIS